VLPPPVPTDVSKMIRYEPGLVNAIVELGGVNNIGAGVAGELNTTDPPSATVCASVE